MTLAAPAKLNLFLRVVGRRADGFHELETVFQSIDLADTLAVTSGDALELTGGCAEAPPGPENLVLRAAAALRTATGCTRAARMHLEKQIPVGAGLGGGSSDAAAALIALNRLWDLRLSRERLMEIAAGLGSDVPFFLLGGAAVGRGRGEILEPLPRDEGSGVRGRGSAEAGASSALAPGPSLPASDPSSLCFVLARPAFPVPTARAYALYRPAPADAPALDAFLTAYGMGDPERLAAVLRNDLEAGVFGEWPELAGVRERLLAAGALGARMTGSGSVLFGLARDEAHARQVARALAGPDLWVRVACARPAEANP